VVIGSLCVWVLLVLLAYFLRAGAAWQFYLLAVAIAIVLGGSQALSRSLFSRLIPAGREAEYFGLYEISDSGTSWLGPLLFGLTYQLSNSYRNALISLVVFFLLGLALLVRVPLRAGIVQAGNAVPDRL
jgi:MFS transporter, UMF1 family